MKCTDLLSVSFFCCARSDEKGPVTVFLIVQLQRPAPRGHKPIRPEGEKQPSSRPVLCWSEALRMRVTATLTERSAPSRCFLLTGRFRFSFK